MVTVNLSAAELEAVERLIGYASSLFDTSGVSLEELDMFDDTIEMVQRSLPLASGVSVVEDESSVSNVANVSGASHSRLSDSVRNRVTLRRRNARSGSHSVR